MCLTKEEAIAKAVAIEEQIKQLKSERVPSWQAAADLGATQRELADALGLSRTTILDQLRIYRG